MMDWVPSKPEYKKRGTAKKTATRRQLLFVSSWRLNQVKGNIGSFRLLNHCCGQAKDKLSSSSDEKELADLKPVSMYLHNVTDDIAVTIHTHTQLDKSCTYQQLTSCHLFYLVYQVVFY